MRLLQVSITATCVLTGAYVGLCVGQLVGYYASVLYFRAMQDAS